MQFLWLNLVVLQELQNQNLDMEIKKRKQILVETAVQIRELLEQLLAHKLKQEDGISDHVATEIKAPTDGRRGTIHIRDLVLAEGDWLMDTVEACDVLGISRVTLGVRWDEGLLTKVKIGKKEGGVRYISSEVMEMRQWYSVRKGKV